MTSSGSVLRIRFHASDLERSPGTIARVPSCSAVAPSKVSNRTPASRCFGSKPWQDKHLSERMGRISRLNWMSAALAASVGLGAPNKTRAAISLQSRGMPFRIGIFEDIGLSKLVSRNRQRFMRWREGARNINFNFVANGGFVVEIT